MASRYAILPRSSIEVMHLPFHGATVVYARSRSAHNRTSRNGASSTFSVPISIPQLLPAVARGGEERTYATKHGTTADLKRTVIPLARSFERGLEDGRDSSR